MTTTEYKYPQTVTQTSGGHYATFTNLNNLKKNAGYASAQIDPKTWQQNRPATITAYNYKFNIPTDARIKKITVMVGQQKTGLLQNTTPPNIPAPTITLNGLNLSKKIAAPTKTYAYPYATFNVDLSADMVNATNFGAILNYPKNTNSQAGHLLIRYIAIKLEYVTPSYSVSAKKISGDYNLDPYRMSVTCSNVNMTNGSPSILINAPSGFSYKSWTGQGTIQQLTARSLKWTPSLNNRTGSNTVEIEWDTNVTLSSGTFTGNVVIGMENYNMPSTTHSVTLTEKPPAPAIEDDTDKDAPDESNIPKSQIIGDDTGIPSEVPIFECQIFDIEVELTNEQMERLEDNTEDYISLLQFTVTSNPLLKDSTADIDNLIIIADETIKAMSFEERKQLPDPDDHLFYQRTISYAGVGYTAFTDNKATISLMVLKDTLLAFPQELTFHAEIKSKSTNILGGK